METAQLDSSPRISALYLKALAALSDELNKTWKRVLPGDERWPRGTCEEFFEPFVRFSVALYDAYAEQRLGSTPFPSLEQYLHALNTDLKTQVCNQIARYEAQPVRTFQDALEADQRGEPPDEWTLRMGESWRHFDHPRHGEVQAMVRRAFLDALSDELNGMRSRLIERIYKAISLRAPHWLAEYGGIAEKNQAQPERADAMAKPEPAPFTQPTPEAKASRRRGPKRDYETASRVAEIVARVAPDEPWCSKLDEILMALDDEEIPRPKTWEPKHGYRNWYAAVADNTTRGRHRAIEAIKHHLKRAKEKPTKTIP